MIDMSRIQYKYIYFDSLYYENTMKQTKSIELICYERTIIT